MNNFIHWMYENNFFIKYGITYDTTDGCSKQYRCENEIWILSAFSFTHRVIIDRCNNSPGYGRSKIYFINGENKHT